MKCKYCGTENSDNSKFCHECGAKIENIDLSEQVSDNAKKRCVICGTENESSASFCTLCGSQLKTTPKPQTTYYNQNNIYSNEDPNAKLAQISMIVGIIGIVCDLTCCLFVIGLVCGIIATILAIVYFVKSKNSNFSSGKAIAGIICGIVATIIAFYMVYNVIVVLNSEEYKEYINEIMNQIYGESENTGLKLFLNLLKK